MARARGWRMRFRGWWISAWVSRDIYQAEIEQGIFWVSVTKDAVVATINNDNPALEAIRKQGVSGDVLENIFISRKMKTWGDVVGHPEITDIIKVYTRSDACGAAKTWAKYLNNHNQDDLTNAADAAINGDPNLMAAIQNDPLGIGFNNINFVYDAKTKEPLPGIQPAPIDLNGNGILDMDENFLRHAGCHGQSHCGRHLSVAPGKGAASGLQEKLQQSGG